MYYGPSRYHPGRRNQRTADGVAARAKQAKQQYKTHADDVDREYNEWIPETMGPGPVRTHLSTYKLHVAVVGAFGEASRDLDQTVRTIARQGSDKTYTHMGAATPDAAFPFILTRIRRSLGIEFVRSYQLLLQHRLSAILADEPADLPVRHNFGVAQAAQDVMHTLGTDFAVATSIPNHAWLTTGFQGIT